MGRWDEAYEDFLARRGVMSSEDACGRCRGLGTRVYGSTATWRGGIGGQRLTFDACDRCWGSGRGSTPWPSHRRSEQLEAFFQANKPTKGGPVKGGPV